MFLAPISIGVQNSPSIDRRHRGGLDLLNTDEFSAAGFSVIPATENASIVATLCKWDTLRNLYPANTPFTIEKLDTVGANGGIFKVTSDVPHTKEFIVKTISKAPLDNESKYSTPIRRLQQLKHVLSAIERQRAAAAHSLAPAVVGEVGVFSVGESVIVGVAMEYLSSHVTLHSLLLADALDDDTIRSAHEVLSELHTLDIVSGDPNLGNFMIDINTRVMKIVDFDMSEWCVADGSSSTHREQRKCDLDMFISNLLSNGMLIDFG